MKNKNRDIFTVLFNIILQSFLFIFSYIIPKRKTLLLFGAGDGLKFSDNSKYIYLYCTKNTKLRAYWCSKSDVIYQKLTENNLPVLKIGTLKHFWYLLRSKYIFLGMSSSDVSYIGFLPGKFNKIQGWHGTPFKKIALDDKNILGRYAKNKFNKWLLNKEYSSYKCILSSAPVVSEKLQHAFKNKNLLTLGYPRNDIFFENTELKLTRDLKLDKYAKIIFYLPTWRDNASEISPFSKNFLIKINSYLRQNNFILLVKKHYLSKNINLSKNLSNIKDVSNLVDDVQELLTKTDLLITDYSSVFFDFALTERPIIYYPYDFNKFIDECRGMYYDYYDTIPGPFAKNENDVLNLLSNLSWFDDPTYKKNYATFLNKFNDFRDGKSSERIINYLYK